MTPSAELVLVPRRKVQLPRPSAIVVPRPRLDAVLDEATRGPATLVSAPAGFGKTFLVASWARREVTRRPVSWVALDRADNDRQRLWSTLVAALASAGVLVPAGADELGGMLVRRDPDVVATLVDVLDDVAQPHVLVLDDVHELVDVDALRELTTLVRSRPRGLHLVMSGRSDPPLHLGRLRLAGELVDVRSELLRFTSEETRRLAVLHGLDLTDTQVRMLTDGTEGWPVGLRLAVVALRDRRADERDLGELLERLLDADPTIADYLTGEVLDDLDDDLDDDVLRFLRVVSITDELPVSLAVTLSGRADAGALLARLARRTALITSTGVTDPEYRVHGLLRSYLRADLDREQPELVEGLHRAAARWYEERGLLGSALDHAGRAGNREWTASFLMRDASELYLRGDLGAAPASVRHIVGADGYTAPALAQVGALVDLATGRLSTVTTRTLAAVDAAEGAEPLLAELVASQAAVLTGRPWEAAGGPRPGESWAQVASGWTALLDGELGRARDELDVAEELCARRGHDVLQLQVHVARAVLEWSDGRYPAMDEPCAAAAALVRERGWLSSPWMAAAQTLQSFRALQLTETQRALSTVAAADRAHSDLLPAGMALLLRAVEAAARSDAGDAVAAAVALRRARHTLSLDAVPRIVVGLAAVVEYELAMRAGAGGGVVRDLLASVDDRLDGTAELALLQARSLVGAPADDEVIRRLAPIRNGAAAALLPSTAVDAELICAALAIQAGDRTVARGAVEKALERAADIELVRPFARAGQGVRAFLVEQAGSFGPYDEFVGRALVATKAGGDERGATPLTVRERSVLARLSTPRSLDEVARDLGVSANTVKTHVRAIYTKFGVTSRRQAVMVARSRGLL